MALPFGQAGNHFAPWIDQHGMAPGAAAILMAATLSGGQNITLILDGPRAQEDLPVGGACGVSEGRRHHNQREIAHGSVKLRESQIVADRKPDASNGRLECLLLRSACTDRHRFVVRFVAFTETERSEEHTS